MSTSAIEFDSAAVDVSVDDSMLRVTLADGRELAVLSSGSPACATQLRISAATGA